MLSFAWWPLLLLLPLPWLLQRRGRHARAAGPALRVPPAVLGALATARPARPVLRRATWLAWLAWALLLAAAARPQWLDEPEGLIVSGRDLLLAIDLSGSMEARDFQTEDGWVDRLTGTKRVANEFIDRRVGDRIGLILFGSEAHLQVPLTFDRETVKALLDEAFIGLPGRRTAIGDAIGLAVRVLHDSPAESGDRVLVLFTDGVSNTGELEPLQGAALAERAGLRIHTIGFGTEAGELGARSGGTDLDERTLTEIADRTGGRYFRARDAAELESIYRELDTLEPVPEEQAGFRPVAELYPWPLAASGLVAAMVFWPAGTRRRRARAPAVAGATGVADAGR